MINRKLLAEAKAGDAYAQRCLGGIYENGRGVQKNCVKAAVWYREAAESPDCDQSPQARVELGILYRDGLKDYAQAAVWFRKSAEDGDLEALVSLADLYTDGLGVRQNHKQAAKFYRKAASRGNTLALVKLGEAYADGKGVRKSFADSYYFLTLAALEFKGKKRVVAQTKAGTAEDNLTAAELSKAKQRVERHLRVKQLLDEKHALVVEQLMLEARKKSAETGKYIVRKPSPPIVLRYLFR